MSQKQAITEPNKLRFHGINGTNTLDDLNLTLKIAIIISSLREKKYVW